MSNDNLRVTVSSFPEVRRYLQRLQAKTLAKMSDHGNLAGLSDQTDHEYAVTIDGSRELTGAWDAGSYGITAETFTSDVATGTAPFTVASTTVVANLNADLLDGAERTAFTENADFNAKGDILSASANDTPLILTVGTNDYVLTAASGEATGLKWAEASGGSSDIYNYMSAWNYYFSLIGIGGL